MHITRDAHFRHGHSTPLLATTAVGLVGAMLLTGCGSHGEDSFEAGSPSATTSASAFSSPVKVKSCDETLTFDAPPKRAILMGDTDASILVKLGVMDSIIGRAGDVMADGYDADTLKKITDVPTITSSELDTGGAKLATETILDQRADLVIGYDEGLDRAALRKAGVKVYAP
ncbi:MAG: ABC transporter substrate-binding protein, partial [Cutibacterium sp.]|nr:ABC transporter substrate-binding protein [Cutibacterium sp.]